MLNIRTIHFRVGTLFLVLLSLAACSTQNDTSGEAAIQPASMDEMAGLPAVGELKSGHLTSAITNEVISPLSRLDNSPDVSESGGSLLLNSSAGQASWAIYAFTVVDAELFSLKGQIGLDPGEGYWLAVANAASGRWEFGSLLQSASFSRNIGGYEADGHLLTGNRLFFAIVAFDGDMLSIDSLSASVEFPPVLHSISGQIKDGTDAPLQGVLLTAIPGGATTNTDASGSYSFPALEAGIYMISPSLVNYEFAPPNANVDISTGNVGNVDFTGSLIPAPTWTADILPLINGSTGETNCLMCHSGSFPEAGRDWSVYANVRDNSALINTRVNLADSDPFQMPQPGPKWSQANLDLFQAWIDGGKLEN
ncbi:MAG: carboxypeptidase-like regulatory domain-containing protein [bacterium]